MHNILLAYTTLKLFCSQIVRLLSAKLNQHSELVREGSTVAINTGVVCYEESDQEPAVKKQLVQAK